MAIPIRPFGTSPFGVMSELIDGGAVLTLLRTQQGQKFWAAEITALLPGAASVSFALGLGTSPFGTLDLEADFLENTTDFYVSDVGYLTPENDPLGVRAYDPYLKTAITIDRNVNLSSGAAALAVSWGVMQISNPRDSAGAFGIWDNIVQNYNVDGRRVRVFLGVKTLDATRGVYPDPLYSTLFHIFTGIAEPWFVGEDVVEIPLRGVEYKLDSPIQTTLYAGTGGLEGTADLANKPKPMARGGSATRPILNVTPVLIDPTYRIYQYTDAAGTIVNLYERGLTGASAIQFQSDTTDLYTGTTNSGYYRTDDSKGLFQLGNTPAGTITCDVTGAFATNGAQTKICPIARYLLTEELGISFTEIDAAAFVGRGATYDYEAGVWYGTSPVQGWRALADLLGSMGGRLIATKTGRLAPFVLTPPGDASAVAASYTTADIVRITPQRMPSDLSPPPYIFKVGYGKNYTIQTTDLASAVTDARRQTLSEPASFKSFFDSTVQAAHAKENAPDPIIGNLLLDTDAQTVANALGALWSAERRLYDIEMWLSPIASEIGDNILITFPQDRFVFGAVAVVVGINIRSSQNTVILRVLT